MTEELYKKHRPVNFKQVLGQDGAIKSLKEMWRRGAFPHTLLLSGPSGCGKTTIARIIRIKLYCSDTDFHELNCADFRGIDMVREIRSRVTLAPIVGKSRVWLIDEAHKLTKDAQTAFLKLLEDTPSHVYFLLATTEPEKLLKTIRTRSTEVKVKLLDRSTMGELLRDVLTKEKASIHKKVGDKIVEVADGSPRMALVLLNQVVGIEDDDDQLAVIEARDANRQAIEIARALMNPKTHWGEMAKILKGVDEEPESLRWMVLSYCTTVMISGSKMTGRPYNIIDAFSGNFYDTKRAGLVAACYEVIVLSES